MINILLVILVTFVFAFTLHSMRDTQRMFREAVSAKSKQSSPPKKEEDKVDIELAPVQPLSDNNAHRFREERDFIQARDHAVLSNPLYPPLNRQALHEYDTYRLLGYIVNEESREDSWHLYGRKKNNNQGEFYLRPSDRNADLKIPLTNDMLNTRYSRLRDIYSLPDNLVIEHPLFHGSQYTVVEYPQHNFDGIYM